jgi:hypothetical protein
MLKDRSMNYSIETFVLKRKLKDRSSNNSIDSLLRGKYARTDDKTIQLNLFV